VASGPVTVVRTRRRSFAGPVILIILGIVFLLGNIGVITWHSLAFWFAHYWPVLIILWGALKLVEYYQAQREGSSYSGVGAGGVILLIFLIFIGVIANRAATVNWNAVGQEMQIDDSDFFGLFGTPYDFTVTAEGPYTAGASVSIMSDRGDIVVHPSSDDKIHVTATQKVYANSQDEAARVSEQFKPTITQDGNTITVHSGGRDRMSADLQISVPTKASVAIDTRHGDLNITDRDAPVTLTTEHGDVHVENIAGNANVTLRHGDIVARNISSDLTVNGRVSDSTVEGIKGSVSFNGDFFGDMTVRNVAKQVRFTSSRTNLEFQKLDGQMTMSGDELRINQATGPLRLTSRSKDFHLTDFSGDIQVDDTNADIEMTGVKTPLGNIDVTNHRGRIMLVVPHDAGFQLDARTLHGDISTDFDLNNQGSGSQSHVTGTVGSGGSRVQLNDEHGDIEIRKTG
jgi:DUF4097 and DUF4098 domain-containing protein YvlB